MSIVIILTNRNSLEAWELRQEIKREQYYNLLIFTTMDEDVSRSNQKKPLCKFINDCRQFRDKKICPFRHDRCKYIGNCKDGENCKFYHPEREGRIGLQPKQSNFKKVGVAQVACKFGKNCNKRALGQCPFNHEIAPTYAASSVSVEKPKAAQKNERQCIYGAKCKNNPLGLCPYKHSTQTQNKQDNQIIVQPSNNTKQQEASEQQIGYVQRQSERMRAPIQNIQVNLNGQFEQWEQKKICRNFVMGQCPNYQCSFTHQFTMDNSLKRVYYKNITSNQDSLDWNLFAAAMKINQNRIYAIGYQNCISFYELDEEAQALKSVCASEIKSEAQIVNLFVCDNQAYSTAKIVYLTSNNKINIFNPLQGSLDIINFPNIMQIVGFYIFTQQNYFIIAHQSEGIRVYKNGENKDEIINKIYSIGPQKFRRISLFKKFKIQGQIFLAVGTETGNIIFINKDFEPKSIQIPNVAISDVCVFAYHEKPYALATVCQSNKKSMVVLINLLDFSFHSILTFPMNKVSKICCVFGTVFIGVDQIGILIYSLPQFRKMKGKIPQNGKVKRLEADEQGNLLMVEKEEERAKSSLSMYRVRK